MTTQYSINANDLPQEYANHSALYGSAVEASCDTDEAYMLAKNAWELAVAKQTMISRETLIQKAKLQWLCDVEAQDQLAYDAAEAGRKFKRIEPKLASPTVADISSHTLLSTGVMDSRHELIIAECVMKKQKGVCDALRTRRDMLVAIGLRVNAEIRGAGWSPPTTQSPTIGT